MRRRTVKVTAQYLAEVAWRAAILALNSASERERHEMIQKPSSHFRSWWETLCSHGTVGVVFLKIRTR